VSAEKSLQATESVKYYSFYRKMFFFFCQNHKKRANCQKTEQPETPQKAGLFKDKTAFAFDLVFHPSANKRPSSAKKTGTQKRACQKIITVHPGINSAVDKNRKNRTSQKDCDF